MDQPKETKSKSRPSAKSKTEQANIQMDQQFYGVTDREQPKETTIPFINRNQS